MLQYAFGGFVIYEVVFEHELFYGSSECFVPILGRVGIDPYERWG